MEHTDRGRKPRDDDKDHIRESSPDRQPTAEVRGRKNKDTSEDHLREYSPERQGYNNSEDSRGHRQRSNERHGGHRQRSNERRGDQRQHSNERNGGHRQHSKERYMNDNRQQSYYQNDWNQSNFGQGGGGRGQGGYGRGNQDGYGRGGQDRGRGGFGRGGQDRGQGGFGRGGQDRGQGGFGRGGQDRGQGGFRHGGQGGFQRGGQYGYDQNYQDGQQGYYPHRNRGGGSMGHWQDARAPTWQQQQGAQTWQQHDGHDQGQRKRFRDRDPVVHLSKSLSFVLRHGAEKKGFKLMQGGFLWVDELLETRDLEGYTEEDVKYVVQSNDKQRFSLEQDQKTGRLKIRANQGHSMEVEGLELTPVTDAKDYPVVIHGTYFQSWEIIKREGLNKMGRNHIHFAAGEPGENGVISGMRGSCEVMIFLDIEKALKEGIKFFVSANNVILSPGDKDGYIRPCFFLQALQRYPRSKLHFDGQISSGPTSPNIPGLAENKKNKKHKKKHKKDKNDQESQSVEGKLKNDVQDMDLSGTVLDDKMEVQETQDDSNVTGVPDHWDNDARPKEETAVEADTAEADKSAPDTPTKELTEITQISDPGCCFSAVEDLKAKSLPVLVYCHMKDGHICSILCVNKHKAFNFILEDDSLMKDGGLKSFFVEKQPMKVFHGIAVPAQALFDQFTILLDGTDVYDTKVGSELMHESGQGNLNDIPFEFNPKTDLHFEGESLKELEEDVLKKCAVILDTYDVLSKFVHKNVKREIFKKANSLIDQDKRTEEMQKRKKERDDKKKQEKQQQDPKKQSHQNQNRKQGKKK